MCSFPSFPDAPPTHITLICSICKMVGELLAPGAPSWHFTTTRVLLEHSCPCCEGASGSTYSVAFYLMIKNAHRFPLLGHENFVDSGLLCLICLSWEGLGPFLECPLITAGVILSS